MLDRMAVLISAAAFLMNLASKTIHYLGERKRLKDACRVKIISNFASDILHNKFLSAFNSNLSKRPSFDFNEKRRVSMPIKSVFNPDEQSTSNFCTPISSLLFLLDRNYLLLTTPRISRAPVELF